MSHSIGLRNARDELMLQVGEVGPQLAVDETIIQDMLIEHLVSSGANPARMSEADLNKGERHLISGFFIGEQRACLVESTEDFDINYSRFRVKPDSPVVLYRQRGSLWLEKDIQDTLDNGAQTVEYCYTDGTLGTW